MYNHPLLDDGSNVCLDIKYISSHVEGGTPLLGDRRGYYLIKTQFTAEHEAYKVYFDEEVQ
jgi:hypothetical protein